VHILLWQCLLSYCSFDYFHCFNLDIVSGDSFVLRHKMEDKILGGRTFTKTSNKIYCSKFLFVPVYMVLKLGRFGQ